jgi:sortase A
MTDAGHVETEEVPRVAEAGADDLERAEAEPTPTAVIAPVPTEPSDANGSVVELGEEALGGNGQVPGQEYLEPEPEGVAAMGEQEEPESRQGRRSPSVLFLAGLVASTVGLCLILFVVYVNSFSTLQQHRAQRILLNEYTTSSRHTLLTGKSVPEGQPAGILTIPAIGFSQVVVQGASATDLLKGPGLMPGTAPPGGLGNAVIAGHRTIAGSPFAHLNLLRPGDRITVVTPTGAYHYRVIGLGTRRPGQRDPTSPNRHPRLTLVTSSTAASGNGRFYVVAALRGTPNNLHIPRHPPTSSERGLSGDAAAVVPSVLWGLLLAGAFAVTLWSYWRFKGRHWSVYVLSTPVLLAITFVWYGNLIRLLPGTM